jgi:APA family basic amino acid/polyamine antiporter
MLPRFFHQLGKRGTPPYSILVTGAAVVMILLALDPTGIAKLASAFQLLMFAFVCFAVIVMRESHIASYDPGYHSPLYPWMQIVGILSALLLIFEMGWLWFGPERSITSLSVWADSGTTVWTLNCAAF